VRFSHLLAFTHLSAANIYLSFNEFSGSIPTEMGLLSYLGKLKRITILVSRRTLLFVCSFLGVEWLMLGVFFY
jgi:hypothetical protein